MALANAEIDIATPVTPSTKAAVGLSGLTGTANIELSGGNPGEENILREAAAEDRPAIIQAAPSQLSTMLQTGESILKRINVVVGQLEGFTAEARQPLTSSLQNVEQFTGALAANSDAIGDFLAAAGQLAKTISDVSSTVKSTVAQLDTLLSAVNPDDLGKSMENARTLTDDLAAAAKRVDGVLSQAEAFVGDLQPGAGQKLVADASETLASVRQITASIGERVDPIVTGLQNSVQKAETILNGLNAEDHTADDRQCTADIGAAERRRRARRRRRLQGRHVHR